MQLEGHRCYYGTGSDCLNIIDHRDELRRRAVLQDIVDGLTVCDALPHVDFVMSMFLPSDVNPMVSDRYQMEAMLNRTDKPIIFVTNEFSGCADAVEMAEIVAGSPEALRQRPFLACYINVTTALRHNQEALEKLLFMAGKGLPVMYIAQASGGVTAPVTPAGCFALINAAALAGLVLTQLKREGTPYILPGWGGQSLDLRTMIAPYCPPDAIGMAHAMAHFYGLPTFGIGGCSDSKLVDGQAVAEATLTLMGETLGGASLVHDMGYLESGLCGSLALLVVCDEIIDWLSHFTKPIEIDDRSLALDLIDDVGLDGQYIDHPHTLANFRQHWYPRVFDRGNHDQWRAKGGKALVQRAAEHVENVLREHHPAPLPDDVQQGLKDIVHRAEENLGVA
jgi:trimethylamine--corrinoid protein Co-methyltransferase